MRIKNSKQSTESYQKARRAISRLSKSSRPDQTVSTICKHLKAAVLADGDASE